ncbi:MAG: sugar ABC transporter ATP-binding protein [Alphaproteobacteria bacterium]
MTARGAPLLEVRGGSKTFGGGVRALDDISITVHPNEIVGVVGENGAGKSTLMKILAGVFAPDRGELYYRGSRVSFPRNPLDAAKRGIAIVYQEGGVVPLLKVYQFLFLGQEDKFGGLAGLQIGKMKAQARAILEELHVACDVDTFMYELPLPTQKMVEIVRAILSVRLAQEDKDAASIIILDEPTAPLSIEERRGLLDHVQRMKESASIIFVSHLIPEVIEFSDRVNVLRDGKLVAHYDMSNGRVTESELVTAIVGKATTEKLHKRDASSVASTDVVLAARELTKRGSYYDISFDLHAGECLGLTGLAGSGKSEIVRTLAGLLSFERGNLAVAGRELRRDDRPHVRLRKGIGYFSGETGKELFLNWPITKNISIVNLEKVLRKTAPILSFFSERRMAEAIVKQLRIRTPGVATDCYALSGGSKQKVSVGRWLERSPRILLLEDPTKGIDVGARADIYETILEMKKTGIAMVLVSDDPKEYATLADKVITVENGRVERVFESTDDLGGTTAA